MVDRIRICAVCVNEDEEQRLHALVALQLEGRRGSQGARVNTVLWRLLVSHEKVTSAPASDAAAPTPDTTAWCHRETSPHAVCRGHVIFKGLTPPVELLAVFRYRRGGHCGKMVEGS